MAEFTKTNGLIKSNEFNLIVLLGVRDALAELCMNAKLFNVANLTLEQIETIKDITLNNINKSYDNFIK